MSTDDARTLNADNKALREQLEVLRADPRLQLTERDLIWGLRGANEDADMQHIGSHTGDISEETKNRIQRLHAAMQKAREVSHQQREAKSNEAIH